jgi:hypothetical protein
MTVYSVRHEKKINPQRPLRGETATDLGLSPATTQRRKGKNSFRYLTAKCFPMYFFTGERSARFKAKGPAPSPQKHVDQSDVKEISKELGSR